ncbi:MAG: hypothetical protein IPK82_16715 [Polyangiaceae bacterium]|nr:hypothetical protein [Polyangiaceae bacterium]
MTTRIATGILGCGSFLPRTVRKNDHWPREFVERDETRRKRDIVDIQRTAAGDAVAIAKELAEGAAAYEGDPFRGAVERRVIGEDMLVSDMESMAARRAISASGLAPDDVDAMLVHSLIPDLLHPSNAPAVQEKTGLHRAVAIAIDNGCASPHVGFVLADSMIKTGSFKYVLVVCSSAASRAVDVMNPASPVFGDGASAYVVGQVPGGYGLLGQYMRTDGYFRDAMVHATFVEGKPERDWYKHAGMVRLATLAPDRARESGRKQVDFCKEACEGALSDAGLTINDVNLFLGPQSIAWLNDSLCKSLGLPLERTLDTFKEVANIGSATMPFNVERAYQNGRLKDGDIVLAYTPGAGLTRASVVFRFKAPPQTTRTTSRPELWG